MATYQKADSEAYDLIASVVEKYHGKLNDTGVLIDCLFAYPARDKNGDSKGPAIKHHGYPAAATIRVCNLKERTKGHGDAEMCIDKEHWDEMDQAERTALVDHELEHLELVYKKGVLKRDDLDRPQLRLKKHDRQFGWFDAVARRHGAASVEAQQATQFFHNRDLTQLYLPGMTAEFA